MEHREKPGQAQKELAHNEALQLLDLVVAGAVEQLPSDSPPVSAAVGSCYIVGPNPTGEWAGRAHALAEFSEGGWRFVAATEGMSVQLRTSGETVTYRGGDWEVGVLTGRSLVLDGLRVVASRQPAIADPSGGATVDAEARATLAAILAALRNHGLIDG